MKETSNFKVGSQDTCADWNRERVAVPDVYSKFMLLEFTNINLFDHLDM
jgi:hypothetical protein